MKGPGRGGAMQAVHLGVTALRRAYLAGMEPT